METRTKTRIKINQIHTQHMMKTQNTSNKTYKTIKTKKKANKNQKCVETKTKTHKIPITKSANTKKQHTQTRAHHKQNTYNLQEIAINIKNINTKMQTQRPHTSHRQRIIETLSCIVRIHTSDILLIINLHVRHFHARINGDTFRLPDDFTVPDILVDLTRLEFHDIANVLLETVIPYDYNRNESITDRSTFYDMTWRTLMEPHAHP